MEEFTDWSAEEFVDWKGVFDDVDNCPACMLSVIRIHKIHCPEFDFKTERDKWWDAYREESYRDYMCANVGTLM